MIRYCIVCLFALLTFQGRSQSSRDSLLQALHEAIADRGIAVNQRLNRIEKLKESLSAGRHSSPQTQFELYNGLYNEYKKFIYDSAFNYASKLIHTAYALRDESLIGYSRIKLGFILISSGMFKESFDSLSRVDVTMLTDSIKAEYYDLMARVYYDLGTYNNDHFYKDRYDELGDQYTDSARLVSKPGSYLDRYLSGLKNLKAARFREAVRDLEQVLKEIPLTNEQAAVNYHNLSFAWQALGETEKAIAYMVHASLADLRSATKETAAMYTLARLLYENNDVKNAYAFIKQAMDDAEYYGARQRKIEIGSILPLIASAELNSVERQRRLWLQYGLVITVLSLLVLVFAIIIFKQLKKLKFAESRISQANADLQQINNQLREANKIKEGYIGYYFTVNSEYLDKIEAIKQSVDNKLSARKYDDIRFIVNNINPKREREELYFSFDKVFLKLFPDFVSTFNGYFKPEDRIVLKDGQLLNTELRIFALIRMGITDTEEIARILNYSVNTIYAYKTRIRSKSMVPNEEFDQKIMEIKSV